MVAILFLALVMSSCILEVPFWNITGGVSCLAWIDILRQGIYIDGILSQRNERVSRTCWGGGQGTEQVTFALDL